MADLIEKRFGVSYKKRAISYLLKELGFSRIN
ncbi:MAG: winged helix-turn-helix domain-containing protein [Hyphomicrobiales bacterium]|nr:winged helix-turn-helix domain-containing protein [Hyphomicrobiales bacterium]